MNKKHFCLRLPIPKQCGLKFG